MNIGSDIDSDIDMINDIRAPKERRFRERVDFMEILDDHEFISRFRVSKISFIELLNARDTGISVGD